MATLTSVLDDQHSPARAVIDDLISDRDALRAIQRRFAENAGPIQVPGLGANPGTVGTAVDIGLRFMIEAHPDLGFAISGATLTTEAICLLAVELLEDLGATISPPHTQAAAANPVLHPLQVPRRNPAELARACWVLALLTEIYRTGQLMPSALARYCESESRPTRLGLLSVAADNEVTEVAALLALAEVQLLEPLRGKTAPWFVGPRFNASRVLDADADLIAGQTLVEIKTTLGTKTKDGSRVTKLELATVRQIIGYVLHDTDNRYALDEVAFYSARYGYLASWPLQKLLDDLAGRPVDLEAERAKWLAALGRGAS